MSNNLFASLLCACALTEALAGSPMSVSPAAGTLTNSQTITLTAAGAGAQGVRWSVSPAVGTLTATSAKAVYTAPANITQSQSVQVMATSASAPTGTAVATLTLAPKVTVSVAPAVTDLVNGSQQSFQASVGGSANTAVNWTVTPASAGTVSSGGMFTPTPINADSTATITATAQADASKSASATVRLHSNSLYFTTQANGLDSVVYHGVDYNYKYGEHLVTSLTFTTGAGTAVTSAPTCTGSFTSNTVTKDCYLGNDPVAVTVTYSTPAAATLQASIQITNNSRTDTLTDSMISTLGVQMAQFDPTHSRVMPLDGLNPVSYVDYGAGQWAIWNNQPTPDISMGVTCGWAYVCKNQPHFTNLAPGQTKSATFTLRFTNDLTETSLQLAPEAYTAFHNAYPPVVNWPDRSPIMAWFISDYSKRSATNPRGYLQDASIDVSNSAAFHARVLSQAQSILSKIKARPIQPQGIVIWDLEGQEFIQPTTYIGDPRVLSEGYAQEMNGVADQVFALFKSAGLKVGVTIRPQSMQWGTSLPSQCQYNALNDYKDYYIKTDNPFGQRFFACYDPAGVNWSLIPQGNGGQTFITPNQPDKVTALLMSKVAYAHSRWGATIFYVDTAVWHGGAPLAQDVFRTLQLAFPDSLFIPEQSYAATMSVAIPYADPKNPSAPKFSPVSWRYIYPEGGLGVYLSNCVGACWTANLNSFKIGQKVGDIAMYTEPSQMSPAQLSTIEDMIQQARSEASLVTVTDTSSGQNYSYRGFPSSNYAYQLKMRVYFAHSAAALPSSSTYCESGQFLGENTCSLNLSGLTSAQVRYYSFDNQLVTSDAPQPR